MNLQGKKTYIVAVLMGLVAVGTQLGWITKEAAATIEALLLGGGLAFLRAGVAKAEVAANSLGSKAL